MAGQGRGRKRKKARSQNWRTGLSQTLECDESLDKHTYPGPPLKSRAATTRDMRDAIHKARVAAEALFVNQEYECLP
jgi:hypothetical protein